MPDRRHLRPVGEDERLGDQDLGSPAIVVDDLEVAHGHVIEAAAEAAECPGEVDQLVDLLIAADAVIRKALQLARDLQGPKET